MKMTRLVAVIAVSSLTLSACKKEPPPEAIPEAVEESAPVPAVESAPQADAQPAVVDPCTLLVTEEIATLLGEEVQAQPSTSGGAQVCTWMSPSSRSVIVQFFSSADRFDASKQTLERFYEGKAEEVPGLGERAISIGGKTGPLATASVSAIKDGRFVIVQILDPAKTAEELKPETIELTRSVLTRI